MRGTVDLKLSASSVPGENGKKRRQLMYLKFTGMVISTILMLSFTAVGEAAVSVYGRVTFIGTTGQTFDTNDSTYHANFRFRVSESTCTGDQTSKERWIIVKSGRMDAPFQHNSANFKNAYNTVMSGFLARTVTHIQVDNVPSCDAGAAQFINLWESQIGLYP